MRKKGIAILVAKKRLLIAQLLKNITYVALVYCSVHIYKYIYMCCILYTYVGLENSCMHIHMLYSIHMLHLYIVLCIYTCCIFASGEWTCTRTQIDTGRFLAKISVTKADWSVCCSKQHTSLAPTVWKCLFVRYGNVV